MDLARLRALLVELEGCDLAGVEEIVLYRRVWCKGLREALPALLDVAEAAETWREVREYMRTEALQLRLSSCGDVEALALAAMKWGTPLEAARLDVEAALAALKEAP